MLAIELQRLIDLDFEIELSGFSLAEVDTILDEARESAPEAVLAYMCNRGQGSRDVSGWRGYLITRAQQELQHT